MPSRKADAGYLPVGGDDQVEQVEELLALGRRQLGEQLRIGGRGRRAAHRASAFAPCGGELDGVARPSSLARRRWMSPRAKQPRDDVGKRGAVDPGPIDEVGLGQTFFLGDGHEYGELPRREPARARLDLENVCGALPGAMEQMRRRAVELTSVL